MRSLLEWFKIAFFQEDFEHDWYGWLTNQISHMSAGIFAALIVSAAWFQIIGEFPLKIFAVPLIAGIYIALEIYRGWFGWDSIEDTIFFAVYGTGGAFLVFSEVTPGSPYLLVSVANVLPVLLIASGHLLAGVVRRWSEE